MQVISRFQIQWLFRMEEMKEEPMCGYKTEVAFNYFNYYSRYSDV